MNESDYQRKFFKCLSSIDTDLKQLTKAVEKLQPAKEEAPYHYICNGCGSVFTEYYNFCPNCGLRHNMTLK